MDSTGTDIVDGWLHRGDPGIAGRTALATRGAGGWEKMSYGELGVAVDRMAARLATLGVGGGDRVVIAGPTGSEVVVALFGAWRRGAVAVPIDGRGAAGELRRVVDRTRASVVVTADEARPDHSGRADARDVSRAGRDPALVVFTSGTGGRAKGATLSFANLAYVVDRGRAAHHLDGDDRWLSVLPLNHTLELSCGLLPALATGACFAFVGRSDAAAVAAAVVERRATRMTVVPLLLGALLARAEEGPAPFAGNRPTLHCGGAALDAAVTRRFDRLGISVYTGYGLTEAAPTVAMNTPQARRDASVGRPLPGTEIRIGDGGEILVRGPGVMIGYWDDPAATAAAVDGDGWLHTGDLGHLDTDGFVYVTGRTKAVIVLPSGRKVEPEEVEAALRPSPLVTEACVVGHRSDGEGEGDEVWAVVVVTPSLRARHHRAEALVAAASDEVARLTSSLAAFKRPAHVRVVAQLPRTAKGTVSRSAVADLLARG